MIGMHKFLKQSEMDEESKKNNVIFKAINTLDNGIDQFVAVHKKNYWFFKINTYIGI